jgi:hypothetical protein
MEMMPKLFVMLSTVVPTLQQAAATAQGSPDYAAAGLASAQVRVRVENHGIATI